MGMLALALAWMTMADPAPPAPGAEPVVYCRQRAFRIPLEVSGEQRLKTKNLRFFVSKDKGATWSQTEEGAPDMTNYVFRTEADGEYWFSMALVDEAGKQTPSSIEKAGAGLKVVIDSKAPALLLKPIRSKMGMQGVRWECNDDNLDPKSLRLAVWESDEKGWSPFVLDNPEHKTAWFTTDQEVGKIQAIVRDRAGNSSLVQVDIKGENYSKHIPAVFVLDDPSHSVAAADKAASNGLQTVSHKPTAPANVIPAEPSYSSSVKSEPKPDHRAESKPELKPEAATSPAPTLPPVIDDAIPPPAPAVVSNAAADEPGKSEEPKSAPEENHPDPEGIALCNSRRVVINYEVEKASEGAVAAVELWGSTNHGRTWALLRVDEDQASPIEAELDHDGLWGLSVVVVGAGSKSEPPASGTEPEVYIQVDTEAPSVEISGVTVEGNRAVIRWKASADDLAEKPVQLFHAPDANGPWQAIDASMPNTGEYSWDFNSMRIKGKTYLRVEVVDEAGNIGSATTHSAIALETVKPKGKVTGVQARPKTPGAAIPTSRLAN